MACDQFLTWLLAISERALVALVPIIAVVTWFWRQWLLISERYPFFTETISIAAAHRRLRGAYDAE